MSQPIQLRVRPRGEERDREGSETPRRKSGRPQPTSLVPPTPRTPAESQPEGRPLRVGDLARLSGKTVRALHLYEELGLLVPTTRTDAGYRLYGADSVVRLEWIARLQDIGFSLPEIRDLLADWEASTSAPDAMRRIQALYARKLEETRVQAAKLAALADELEQSLAYLDTCDSCEPVRVVSACSSCDRHQCDTHPPVLVAGFHTS